MTQVAFGDISTGGGTSAAFNVSHTIASGEQLVVGVLLEVTDSAKEVSSVTWNPTGGPPQQSLTRYNAFSPSHGKLRLEVWYLLNPTAQANKNVSVNIEGGNSQKIGVVCLAVQNGDATTLLSGWTTDEATDTAGAATNIEPSDNDADDLAVAFAGHLQAVDAFTPTDAGMGTATERADFTVEGTFRMWAGSLDARDAGGTDISWSQAQSKENSTVGFLIKAAAAGGNVTVTPTTLALTTARFAPTILLPKLVVPTTKVVIITAFTPILKLAVIPPTRALVLTTFAPTITLDTPEANVDIVLKQGGVTIATWLNQPVTTSIEDLILTITEAELASIAYPATDLTIEVNGDISGGANSIRIYEVKLVAPEAEPGGGNVTVTPTTASLSLSTFAPSVVAPKLVTPTTASLTVALFAPTIALPKLVTPTTTSLTTTSFAPSIVLPRLVTPAAAALTTTSFAPTVAAPRLVTPATASLATTTFTPVVSAPRRVVPTTGVLVITTFTPVVFASEAGVFVPITATLVTTTFVPTILAPRIVTPTPGSLILTTYAPAVTVAPAVTPPEPPTPGIGGRIRNAFPRMPWQWRPRFEPVEPQHVRVRSLIILTMKVDTRVTFAHRVVLTVALGAKALSTQSYAIVAPILMAAKARVDGINSMAKCITSETKVNYLVKSHKSTVVVDEPWLMPDEEAFYLGLTR